MVNWSTFADRFYQKEQWAFENMAYFLFCSEYKYPIGIFRYKNQPGLETEPIEIEGKQYGFQAKYVDSIRIEKNDIIDSIRKAKKYHPQLNTILLYVNKEPSKKSERPKYLVEIDQAAETEHLELVWRVPSHLEVQLLRPHNKWIYEIFDTMKN